MRVPVINNTDVSRCVKNFFIALVGYWWREYRRVFHDAEILVFFFLLTLAYPILYALIYNPERVRDVPIVVVDDCRTALSRSLVRNLDATPAACVMGYSANMQEARVSMMQRDCYAILVIPDNFETSIVRGVQGTLLLYTDMSLLLNYKSLLMALTDVTMAMDTELREEVLPIGLSQSLTDIINAPIPYAATVMYNPSSGVASFLIPAVLILVLQQSLILGIATLAGAAHEKKRNWYTSNFLVAQLFGRTLCYFSLYIFNAVYLLHFIPWLFGYPQLGNVIDLLLFVLPLLLSSIFMASALSIWVRRQEYAYLLFVATSVIFLFLSGIAWPRYAMPWLWKVLAAIIPSTWGIEGYVHINTMGSTLEQVSQPYIALWILTIAYFIVAYIVARRTRFLAKY